MLTSMFQIVRVMAHLVRLMCCRQLQYVHKIRFLTLTTVSNPMVITGGFLGLQSHDNCGVLDFRIEEGAASVSLPSTSSISFNERETGIRQLTVWAIDEAGNTSNCTVEMNLTTDFTQHRFSGTVFIDEGNCEMEQIEQAIEGIEVKVLLK